MLKTTYLKENPRNITRSKVYAYVMDKYSSIDIDTQFDFDIAEAIIKNMNGSFMGNSYYTEKELNEIGFKNIGKEVYISKKASIYGAENITIGSYVRIDDFCILSGNIVIGSFVHIAAYSALYGGKGEGIVLEDFVTLSSRNAVYAATDDYYGNGLSNPLLGDEFRNVYEKKVVLEKHVLIGTGCTILPGVTIHEGTSVGAMSLIKCNIEEWGVYVGVPSRRIANREKKVQELEQEVYNSIYRNVN